MDHLSFEERAKKLVLQSVSNSIAQLRKTPGRAAKDQEKVIVAPVTHHRWGTPALEESISWRTKSAAKQMKINLLTGTDALLIPPPMKKRKILPDEVEKLAAKHWMESTIPEPSVHRRITRKINQRRMKRRKLSQPGGSTYHKKNNMLALRTSMVKGLEK